MSQRTSKVADTLGKTDKSKWWIGLVGILCAVYFAGTIVSTARTGTGSTQPLSGSWKELGPDSPSTDAGRVLSVAASGNDLYIGSAGGGVWRSRNQGKSWTPLTDHEPSLASSSVIVDPKHPQTLYVGTGEGTEYVDSHYGVGVLKSVDGGKTWHAYGPDVFGHKAVNQIVMSPDNDRVLYAASDNGIAESKDAGQTWRLIHPTGNHLATSIGVNPRDPQELFAGITAQGVFHSTDSGRTWQKLPMPIAMSKMWYVGVTVDPNVPGRVYLLAMSASMAASQQKRAGLFVSNDNGQHWRHFTGLNDAFTNEDGMNDFGVIAVDPTDSQHLFVGSVGMEESSNGGQTWSPLFDIHPDVHQVTFARQGTAYIATDGGIWVKQRHQLEERINGNLGITEFYPGISVAGNGSDVIGGTQDTSTMVYGLTVNDWTTFMGGDGGYTAINPTDSNQMYVTVDGDLYRSGDKGEPQVITPIYTSPKDTQWAVPFEMDPKHPNRLILGADRVYVTTDCGDSWQPISQQFKVHGYPDVVTAVALVPGNPNMMYAGTMSGVLYMTTDGGSHWQDVSPLIAIDGNTSVMSIIVSKHNPRAVYISYGQGTVQPYTYPLSNTHVLVTKNVLKPDDWQDVSGNLPVSQVTCLVVSGSHVFAGTDRGVYVSNVYGSQWQRVGTGLPNAPVTGMVLTPKGDLIAATAGRGMWLMHHMAALP